jgi:hypothetical protein
MSDTNTNTPNVFDAKLINLEGLGAFWGKAYELIKGDINTAKSGAETVAAGYTDEKVGALAGTVETLSGAVDTNTSNISNLQTIVSGLVGGEGAEGGISGMIAAAIAPISTTVDGHATMLAGLTKDTVQASINDAKTAAIESANGYADSKIADLTHVDANDTSAGDKKYVSKVEQANGKVTVTYTELPDYSNDFEDFTEGINEAKEAAQAVTDDLAAHKVATDKYATTNAAGEPVEFTGNIHISGEDRYNWNLAATRIDTFLNATETEDAIDNLAHINKWFNDHGTEYSELFDTVQTNTTSITTNTNSIAAITNYLSVTGLATIDECEGIVTDTTNNQ